MKKRPKIDTYQLITDRICDQLEAGTVPWRKPWKGCGYGPTNLVSKNEYRGINAMMLECTPYSSNYFVTYKQAKLKGGTVRGGEKGFPVVKWKFGKFTKKDDTGEDVEKQYAMLRHFTVFNIEQCDGIEEPAREEATFEHTPVEQAEKIIEVYGADIRFKQQRAYYSPGEDYVNMPKKDSFPETEKYYSTMFHELAHHTGHSSRLKRHSESGFTFFGDHEYSKEELVAEFGASFLCADCRIERATIDNSAAYIKSWLTSLRNDKKLLIQASGKAQKAARYIKKEEEPTYK